MFLPLKKTPITTSILAITLICYVLQQIFTTDFIVQLLISSQINVGLPEINQGEFWRLFTPIFLHFGLIHLVGNCALFYFLGQIIELRFKPVYIIIFILISASVSNLAQFWHTGPAFGGLSGVIFAMVSFVWIQGKLNSNFRIRIPNAFVIGSLIIMALFWLNIPILSFGQRVGNTAHTIGFISGIALAFLFITLKIPCKPLSRL